MHVKMAEAVHSPPHTLVPLPPLLPLRDRLGLVRRARLSAVGGRPPCVVRRIFDAAKIRRNSSWWLCARGVGPRGAVWAAGLLADGGGVVSGASPQRPFKWAVTMPATMAGPWWLGNRRA